MQKIRETQEFRITKRDQPLRISRSLDNMDYDPTTVPDFFKNIVDEYSDHPALAYTDEVSNEWQFISYKDFKEEVEKFAKIFIKLGLKRWDAVAVLASNSVEWCITELAVIHAG